MAERRETGKKTRSGNRGRKLTRELARTWLITVINPLLQGLRRETFWLHAKNWSWRYSTGVFEYLWPAEVYIAPSYRDNFPEFLAWYPRVAKAIQAHDSGLRELAATCNVTYKKLWESGDFPGAVMEADTRAAEQNVEIEQARGAAPLDHWPRLLAEYLINNVRSLPEHYTTVDYWRVAGTIILNVRNAEPLRDAFEKLESIGTRVLEAGEKAEHALISVRQDYTKRFGLPPVPLSGAPEA